MREAKNENNEGQKMKQKIEIRDAQVDDSATILQFIRELAVYEKQGDAVTATVESIAESLFSAEATAHAILCLRDDKPIGFAVYFYKGIRIIGLKQGYKRPASISCTSVDMSAP